VIERCIEIAFQAPTGSNARGIGACWTTDHLLYEPDAARILGIPDTITQVALLPVAYFTGADFKPAQRLPARERTHWNGWGVRRTLG